MQRLWWDIIASLSPFYIKADTLFRNAKAFDANCKKELAICIGKDSPYCDFDGNFSSGINWENYLLLYGWKCVTPWFLNTR